MKIEKKRVTSGFKFSNAARTAIAAAFGIAATAAVSGCSENSDSIAGPTQDPVPTSSNTESEVDLTVEPNESKADASSSSQVVDIPSSHEAVSSSVIEALSSAAAPSKKYSSSYISSGVSSARAPQPVSSSSSNVLAQDTTNKSSDITPNSSNSGERPVVYPRDSINVNPSIFPIDTLPTPKIDTLNVHLCNEVQTDSTGTKCYNIHVMSMVTTFELDDITA